MLVNKGSNHLNFFQNIEKGLPNLMNFDKKL